MKKRAKATFAGFNYNENPAESFYDGLNQIMNKIHNNELTYTDESIIEKLRESIIKIEKNIAIDFESQINRLDKLLYDHLGAIPEGKGFTKWFYNKTKVSKLGKNLQKITDDDLINYTKIYINEFREKCENNPEKKISRLSVKQIALIHAYEGIQITRQNAGNIALKHGYVKNSSGEGLYQDYSKFCSQVNRKAQTDPFTVKKMKNKIELFESVVPHLTKGIHKAKDEIKLLKNLLKSLQD